MAKYWLMKSEPNVYSIEDLERDRQTHWEGVRNYQARNLMRDQMQVGDLVLYYHSNSKPPGVVGIARICREAYPDFTSWDSSSKYFDEKSSPENPRWFMVDIEFVENLPGIVSLEEIKSEPSLKEMVLVNRSRLSVQPVKKEEFEKVLKLAGKV